MADTPITQEELASLLREAEAAHASFEEHLGHRDDDWPAWYAAYIVSKLQERQEPPSSANRQAPT